LENSTASPRQRKPERKYGTHRIEQIVRGTDAELMKGICMKKIGVIALAVVSLVGCDRRKNEIDDQARQEKKSLDADARSIDRSTAEAKKQADVEAQIEKVKIEARQQIDKAQIEADKKKADAEAAARKKAVDIERQANGSNLLK
jgi:uncharacterized lipoprotein NlpE involved in copper resistance